ncbi:monovalent cation/H(+) antiporter subunit G [Pueribacillus sp. YX66]|uniref:monovalent cation/H(+) antiporter subunit G n=1 Tax=Pueribacillus sp. YX66 TaxID=3229242 RepID=UPI00358D685D
MTTTIINALVVFLISAGVLFSVVAAIGLNRFPDVYSRLHAASKSSTLGVLSILLGIFLYFWLVEGHFNSSILLGIAFLFITAPISGHLIGRAAYMSGVNLWEKSVGDDLAEVSKKEKQQ